MKTEELSQIAHKWFDAFNGHNLEKLLSLYEDHAEHYSPKLKVRQPETNGLIKGKAALRAWWQDAFDRLPSLQYEVLRLTPHDDRVFMEYIRHVVNEEDIYVGEMLEVRNGLIVASAVFHR
ncbi:MAG TPA: nuclear transport factor 2 family protein [Cyclobacteriaceae bacterium]|nr:nuclear transport factor 2 family protein [Cyclobacteriaceae bacterium]